MVVFWGIQNERRHDKARIPVVNLSVFADVDRAREFVMNRAILKINIEQKDPERLLGLLIVDENLSTASLYREQIGLSGVV
ncbi:hypothetical protein AN465_03390 [Pseudomonas aeruginosa]|nr:hypothetical protein EG09_07570 [Pseudomonas aeruginosa]AKE69337.1 hypothetical protein YQ19_14290 [Pseudomonas aeruginosa]ARG51656.1 hypothetical protein BFV99_20650 [Pseudomonas aeruginosa]KTF49376.1 hypothetical protein WM51_29755 [Pseudomonas aeruginosa]OFB87792.1 hypothetical protein AN473_32815 [Pseudomonas aeruginosa]